MPIVRIEHAVPNFDKWKQAFDSDPADRKGSGVRHYQVLRAQDDPNYVMIDLEFETLNEAEAFLRTMQRIWGGPGKAVMQSPRAHCRPSGSQGVMNMRASPLVLGMLVPIPPVRQ